MKAGRILAWDRAREQDCVPPVYAMTNGLGRSHVIIGNHILQVGAELPDNVYTDARTHRVEINRYVPEDEWPDEVCVWMAKRALGVTK